MAEVEDPVGDGRRINSTARHADYVLLPAALVRKHQPKVGDAALALTSPPPTRQRRCWRIEQSDWDIINPFSKHIQERAVARGITSVKSPQDRS